MTNNLVNALNAVNSIFAAEANITVEEFQAAHEYALALSKADFLNAAQHGLLAGNSGIIAPSADFCASKVFIARTPVSVQVNDGVATFRRSAKSLKGAMQRATSDAATHLPFTVGDACILKVDSLMAMNLVEDDEVGFFPEPFLYQRPFNGDARSTSTTIKFGAYSTGKMDAAAIAEATAWRNLLAAEIHKVLVRMGLGASTAPMMLQLTGFCSDYRPDEYTNQDGSTIKNYGFPIEQGGFVFSLERIHSGRPDDVHSDVAVKKKSKSHYRDILRAKAARSKGNPLPAAAASIPSTPAAPPTVVAPVAPVAPAAPSAPAQVAVSRPKPETVTAFPDTWTLTQKAFYSAAMFNAAFGAQDKRSIQGAQFYANVTANVDNPFTNMPQAMLVMPTLNTFKSQVKAAEVKSPDKAAGLRQAIDAKNAQKSAPVEVAAPVVETPAPVAVQTPAPTPAPVAAGGSDLRSKLLAARKDTSVGFVTDDQAAPAAEPNIAALDDDDVQTGLRSGFPGQ